MSHMTNFRAEDMVKIAHAKDSPEPGEQQDEQQQEPGQDQESVPDGTTAEILQWVGDDKDRAQRALDKENADDSPRKGLIGELEKKLEE